MRAVVVIREGEEEATWAREGAQRGKQSTEEKRRKP